MSPEEITVGDIRALIYPPHRSKLELGDVTGESGIAASDIPRRLDPLDPQALAPGVQIGDGPAIVGDVFRIDFLRESFDRRHGSEDPPIELAFNLTNSWIRRFRVLSRAGWIKPLSQHSLPWKLEILNDDEVIVEPAEGQWRRRLGAVRHFQYAALDSYGWDAVATLPENYQAQPSDELLLDAYALLPQIGPAIVLAYSAVETRIAQALDRLAELTGVNPALWSWLINRGDFTKDPSTAEQLDVLARTLGRRSLKDDARLWEGFQNLRSARNRFVHEGKASIGRERVEVNSEQAGQLVNSAELIIDWIENLLPQAERRPRVQSPNKISVADLIWTPPNDVVTQNDISAQPNDEEKQRASGKDAASPQDDDGKASPA